MKTLLMPLRGNFIRNLKNGLKRIFACIAFTVGFVWTVLKTIILFVSLGKLNL